MKKRRYRKNLSFNLFVTEKKILRLKTTSCLSDIYVCHSVASLGWVTPGAATEGVTSAVSPLFIFYKK